jgi:hypothetical protein
MAGGLTTEDDATAMDHRQTVERRVKHPPSSPPDRRVGATARAHASPAEAASAGAVARGTSSSLGPSHRTRSLDRGCRVEPAGATSGRRIDAIDIGGTAGNTTYGPTAKRILVNVQDRAHIAVIDPATDRVNDTIDTLAARPTTASTSMPPAGLRS